MSGSRSQKVTSGQYVSIRNVTFNRNLLHERTRAHQDQNPTLDALDETSFDCYVLIIPIKLDVHTKEFFLVNLWYIVNKSEIVTDSFPLLPSSWGRTNLRQ